MGNWEGIRALSADLPADPNAHSAMDNTARPIQIQPGLPEANPTPTSEADAAADERFEFLIHTFLAGLPDPPPRRDALDAPSVLDLTSSLEVAPGLTGRV